MFKAVPDDFRVQELAGFEPAGEGEHLYLCLEKTELATPEVAEWLAKALGVPAVAVGYAGMKDKRAVTTQWFSVHTPHDARALPGRSGVKVITSTRHQRKLRRGQLAGNSFCIRLREVAGESWPEQLATVRERGVPNYFGPQRFGVDNLERARDWLARGRRRRGRDFLSGFYLSVLRSFLFNEVLAERVVQGSWRRLLPGDVAVPLPGDGDAASQCGAGDGRTREAPTGPLWGRGRSPAADEALAVEQKALAPHAGICDGLEHAGLDQQRRSLVLAARDLTWRQACGAVEVTFTLPPGGYATTLLDGVFQLVTPGAGS